MTARWRSIALAFRWTVVWEEEYVPGPGGSNPAAAWLGARSTISGNTAFSYDGVNGLFGSGGVHVNAPATASFFNATVWANLDHDDPAGTVQHGAAGPAASRRSARRRG